MIDRYTRPEMGHIFSLENKYAIWQEIEVLACEAQAELGKIGISKDEAQWIRDHANFEKAKVDEIEEVTRHDVIAFLTNMKEYIDADVPEGEPKPSRWVHYGMTSSDLGDTALCYQLTQACDLIIEDVKKLGVICKRRAFEERNTLCAGRTHGIHAEPMTFGMKFGSWAWELKRDLDRLREQPKWIVGFSDVTMLHLALGRLGVESLHATMPGKFRFGRDETPEAIVSDEALRSALLGLRQRIDTAPHPLNSPGTARGRLTGGNLAIVCSSLGTPEEPDFDAPTVLFIEEVGEHMYRLDRMMQQLARSGKLAKCKAILVGHFSDMAGQKHFGITDPYDIVAQYVRPLGIPVVFGLPAGHEDPNVALYMGREVTVTVGETGAAIEF